MKTVPFLSMAMGVLLSAFIITGCKKGETGPAGPQGPQGPQGPVLTFINNGFVTGTISGTRKDDNVAFSEPFSYNYYYSSNSDQMDSVASNYYTFSVNRYTNDIFANNSASFNITTNSKTATTGTLNLNFYFDKMLSSNKLFSFNANMNTASVTGLSYNSSTGLFTGNFNVTIPGSSNSTNNTATLTGSFQATVIRVVNKQQILPVIKTN